MEPSGPLNIAVPLTPALSPRRGRAGAPFGDKFQLRCSWIPCAQIRGKTQLAQKSNCIVPAKERENRQPVFRLAYLLASKVYLRELD